MFARLTRYIRRHKSAEEKLAEGVAVGVGVRVAMSILAAGAASAAITYVATEPSTFHPNFPPSAKLVAFVERHEGVRYVPYQDPGGKRICTVGAGHVLSWHYGCTAAQLRTTYSPAQVAAFLRSDLGSARSCITGAFTRHLTQPEYEALVDMVFNAGCGSLGFHYGGRTIAGTVAAGDVALLPGVWEHIAVTASGVYLGGLAERRADEVALYTRSYYGAGIGYFVAPRPLTKLQRAELALRERTGYYSWLAWYLHEGAWRPYAVHAAIVRPHIPARIPAAWWRRERAFVKARR